MGRGGTEVEIQVFRESDSRSEVLSRYRRVLFQRRHISLPGRLEIFGWIAKNSGLGSEVLGERDMESNTAGGS